jgi:hypothetical protein
VIGRRRWIAAARRCSQASSLITPRWGTPGGDPPRRLRRTRGTPESPDSPGRFSARAADREIATPGSPSQVARARSPARSTTRSRTRPKRDGRQAIRVTGDPRTAAACSGGLPLSRQRWGWRVGCDGWSLRPDGSD